MRSGEEIGALMAKNRSASLKDIQLGPVLQEMTEISLRHDVPLPASLTLTGKALAQMQLAAAQLDPELDPFDVAGKFLMRTVFTGMGSKLDLKAVFYQTQKLKVRALRVIEAVERLIGARPGQKLEVNFRAASLETTIRRAGRRLALGLTAGAAILATSLTATLDARGRLGAGRRSACWRRCSDARPAGRSDPPARLTHATVTRLRPELSGPGGGSQSSNRLPSGSTAHPKRPSSDSSSASITSTPAERNWASIASRSATRKFTMYACSGRPK